MLGDVVSHETLTHEIAPCFHEDARGKTDAVILGCTHYPLLLNELRDAAPWDVAWIDASGAIARRALSQVNAKTGRGSAYVTGENDMARYRAVFAREGFEETRLLA